MPLSWNEIRSNAVSFSRDWKEVSREDAEAKSFWDEFFAVFGIKRRTVASFEEPVKKLSGSWGYIDLFWPGTLLVEHKSRGQSLDRAHAQAMDYIRGLKDAHRDEEIPPYLIVSDFGRIALHDLDKGTSLEFPLAELHKNIGAFGFIPGYKQHTQASEDPINVKAVELLGELHDSLEAGGYRGHDLERFLVRILFCLFAEDTGLFERNTFTEFLINHTKADGSDLGTQLARLFKVLDTPPEKRQTNLLQELLELPYVNGHLFEETLDFAECNRAMRDKLLCCCRFDWSRISPAVFGSLFQCVMEPKQRRKVGAHYTSEQDILKLIRSLFLDDLREEFERIKNNRPALVAFHDKLSRLAFLDPACGCGNFLVVSYRELRLLELEVVQKLHKEAGGKFFDINQVALIDVSCMYGIEINEFPVRIAEVALWLIDHQINLKWSEVFGQYYARLPFVKSARIVQGNALQMDWNQVLPKENCSFVLGNPPFVGKSNQNDDQKKDMEIVFGDIKKSGLLDYVCGWYIKAADYIQGTKIHCAFVSTNSISQGEQVAVLWNEMFKKGIQISFAHRTFSWQSEARGKAHVHVIIVGFGKDYFPKKRIFDYETEPPTSFLAKNISPYLIEGNNAIIISRNDPICNVPKITSGNKPVDNGFYLFEQSEMDEFIKKEPKSKKYFRRWIGSDEFINGWERWCLWLWNCPPNELKEMPEVLKRVECVVKFRLKSKKPQTIKLANTPTRFEIENVPISNFLLIPAVSSERRPFIPIGFMDPETIISNLCNIVSDAGVYHFGVLSSTFHMAWVRLVCGRLKSDYRYSNKLVYNNYPWPQNPTEKQIQEVEVKAQKVLDTRAEYPQASLADLYDPLTMPAPLAKAHAELDRAVELCYRPRPFENDRQRVEFLFGLYEELTRPLLEKIKKKKS